MSPRSIAFFAAAGALLAAALGLYWKGRIDGATRERPKIEVAAAQAAISRLETLGERGSAQRVEVVVRQRDAAARTVTQLIRRAMISEDAHAPLAPDRAARLRAHDRELCLAAPQLAGCTADPDSAGSEPAVRYAPSAGTADAG